MPFCPKCGYKLNDGDMFCYQCGNKIEADRVASGQPQVNNVSQPAQPIQPTQSVQSAGPAYLVVSCLASSRAAYVSIMPHEKGKSYTMIKAGETGKIEYAPGEYVVTFVVDRGPGLTVVASRNTRYQKRLTFHPGETITMDANVGKQMTQVNYQSSLGYQIV